ncbi:U3 Small Nucleolar Rna-Associated Protein 18-like [Manis pentadactyla]|nr:U3 Small Nucleolar Rna-Associated Protein 18-like [Manis pentadactyla]
MQGAVMKLPNNPRIRTLTASHSASYLALGNELEIFVLTYSMHHYPLSAIVSGKEDMTNIFLNEPKYLFLVCAIGSSQGSFSPTIDTKTDHLVDSSPLCGHTPCWRSTVLGHFYKTTSQSVTDKSKQGLPEEVLARSRQGP